jgi:hypothetical protein
MGVLKVIAVVCVFTGAGVGILFLDKYVRRTAPARQEGIVIELAGVPAWVNDQLKDKVYTAAGVDSGRLKLDENAAIAVQQNIAASVAWLDDVRVQTTHEGLRIAGRWRKPVALLKFGPRKFYVDARLVALDFVPISNLAIVEVKGLSQITGMPQVGEVWQRDDLAAAVDILVRLGQMDELVTPDKPLLCEIDSIDVSNFNGKKSARLPHIVLYSKDGTEIIWGAEIGSWAQHLEATDEEKLAKLYGYYKEYGSLQGGAKYINLRDPLDRIPLPVDKY